MSLKLFDYQCYKCSHIHEELQPPDKKYVPCPKCNGTARKIISLSGVNCANENTDWLRSVAEVVDKDSNHPVDVAMRTNPTRTNYQNWMKEKGLRHFEPGEKPKKPEVNEAKIMKEVWKRSQQRHKIEVRE